MNCETSSLTTQQKTDLVNFVTQGGKLIIYDSECAPGQGVDYSWLPFPFTTSNPGALGVHKGSGYPWVDLKIVEDNRLSHSNSGDPFFVDAEKIATETDAAGDANVMTTRDVHWCVDMEATNAVDASGQVKAPGTMGPTHTYTKPGSIGKGEIIYNGLDYDDMGAGEPPGTATGDQNLAKVFLQELLEAWNPWTPGDKPCLVPVVPTQVPTLTEWGMISLTGLFGLSLGVMMMVRRRRPILSQGAS